MDVNTLMQDVREAEEALRKWKLLQRAPAELRDLPEVRCAEAWWLARYQFVDKKKTRTQDRYVWLLMVFSSWAQQGRFKKTREPIQLFEETFGAPEFVAALESYPDGLGDALYDAADVYVRTLRQGRAILGLMRLNDKNAGATNTRVAKEVVHYLMFPFAVCVRDKPHADAMVRALYNAAVDNYKGIRSYLLDAVDEIEEGEVRSFLLGCLNDAGGPYDGSAI